MPFQGYNGSACDREIMMGKELRPYMPTHPGEVLKDELQARGISQKKFSSLVGVSYTMLNEILNGKRPVSADMSLLLEAALGIDAAMDMYLSKDAFSASATNR